MSNNQKILDKIRNLLTLAEDASDTEGQTALLMAQKLMLKYKICLLYTSDAADDIALV